MTSGWHVLPAAREAAVPEGKFIAVQINDSQDLFRGYIVQSAAAQPKIKTTPVTFPTSSAPYAVAVTRTDTPPPSPPSGNRIKLRESVLETVYSWLRAITTWSKREAELVSASEVLFELFARNNVAGAIAHINSIQRLLGLPVAVRMKNGEIGSMPAEEIAREQIRQATPSALSYDESWAPRILHVRLLGLEASHRNCPAQHSRLQVKMSLWNGSTRLSVTWSEEWAPHESVTTLQCAFKHCTVAPEPEKVSLVIELGSPGEHGFKYLAVGIANISMLLRPCLSSNAAEVVIPVYALRPGDRKGWGSLYKRMISGGATGLVWPKEIVANLRRLRLVTSIVDAVPSGISEVASCVRDCINTRPEVWLDVGMFLLRGGDSELGLTSTSDTWLRIAGIETYARSGQDVGLGLSVSASGNYNVELYHGTRLIARGCFDPSNGVKRISLRAVPSNGDSEVDTSALQIVGHVAIHGISLAALPVSESLYREGDALVTALGLLELDGPSESTEEHPVFDGPMRFKPTLDRLITLCGQQANLAGVVTAPAAFSALLELLRWVSAPHRMYLCQCIDGKNVEATSRAGLVAQFTQSINSSAHANLCAVFAVAPLLGKLLHPGLPTVSSADSMLPLTQALMGLFSAPPSKITHSAQATCLDVLDALYLQGGYKFDQDIKGESENMHKEENPIVRLAAQLGSVLDCIRKPGTAIAPAFYRLLGRLAKSPVFTGPLQEQFVAHVYQWTESFWTDTSSKPISEIRAMAKLLIALPSAQYFLSRLTPLTLELLNSSRIVIPSALFSDAPLNDDSYEAALELCVVIHDATRRAASIDFDPGTLVALAKHLNRTMVPRQWISLNALLCRTCLQLLELASGTLALTASVDLVDDEQAQAWKEILETTISLAGKSVTSQTDLLAAAAIRFSGGDIRTDSLALVVHAWDNLGPHQSMFYKSSILYSHLLQLAFRSPFHDVLHAVGRVLVSTMAGYLIAQGSLSALEQVLIEAVELIIESSETSCEVLSCDPLLEVLSSDIVDGGPEEYRRFIHVLKDVMETQLTLMRFPSSLLVTDMLLEVLGRHGLVDIRRRRLERLGATHHSSGRTLGIIYVSLARTYSFEDTTALLPPLIKPPLPPHTSLQRQEALIELACLHLSRAGAPELAIAALEELLRKLSQEVLQRQDGFKRIAKILPELAQLYSTVTVIPPQNSHWYFVSFPKVLSFGVLGGTRWIFNGGSRRLEQAIDSLSSEFGAPATARGGAEEVQVHTVTPLLSKTAATGALDTMRILRVSEFINDSPHGSKGMLRTTYQCDQLPDSLSGWNQVTEAAEKILGPEIVAQTAMRAKAAELRRVCSTHSRVGRDRVNHLELLLQGAVHAPINGGVRAWTDLLDDEATREAYEDLRAMVTSALEVYESSIQNAMRPHCDLLRAQFAINYCI